MRRIQVHKVLRTQSPQEGIDMEAITVKTSQRTEFIDITKAVAESVRRLGLERGMATVFVPHTTAGITINENADPDVLRDMSMALDRMIPWSGPYRHGEGNSAAHVKASLMGSTAQVIVEAGDLRLGTWQSLFFCEFDGPRTRQLWVTAVQTVA